MIVKEELERAIETLHNLEDSLLEEGSYWDQVREIQNKRSMLEDELYTISNGYENIPETDESIWFTINKLNIPLSELEGEVFGEDGLKPLILSTISDNVFSEILNKYKQGINTLLLKVNGGQVVSISNKLSLISEGRIKEIIRKIIHKEDLSLKSKSKSKPILYGSTISGSGSIKEKQKPNVRTELSDKQELDSLLKKASESIIKSGSSG